MWKLSHFSIISLLKNYLAECLCGIKPGSKFDDGRCTCSWNVVKHISQDNCKRSNNTNVKSDPPFSQIKLKNVSWHHFTTKSAVFYFLFRLNVFIQFICKWFLNTNDKQGNYNIFNYNIFQYYSIFTHLSVVYPTCFPFWTTSINWEFEK